MGQPSQNALIRSIGLALVAALVVAVPTACSWNNGPIDRPSVNPYWSKEYFAPDQEWYVRSTIVDAPPEHGWVSIGDGDWLMLEKIRWEITENMLVGWRTYAVAPGSEIDQSPGAQDTYRGEPVAMFRISDHFDIRREFNPGTGEESNVIGENRDRLWFDRAYMRVDWSRNMVPTYKFHILLDQFFDSYVVANNDPGNPEHWRFEDNYFEVTTRSQVAPDVYSYFGWYGVPYMYDGAGAVISVRHSFMKVPKSDYQPRPMPPTVVLEDENGQEVRDANGFAVRIPVNDRFGFFGTLGRNQFDENRGMVSSGQVFNASLFNIWQRHTADDGSVLPVEQRTPKPIVYYTNVEHPKALMNGSMRVGAEWNRAFRDTVWKLQPSRYTGALDATGIPSDVPEMFIVRENDCNVSNVEAALGRLPSELRSQIETSAARDAANPDVVDFDGSIATVKARIDEANADDNTNTFTERTSQENQALHDLERVCSALEYFTGGDITRGIAAATTAEGDAIAPFHYQRVGDTRYSLLNLIVGEFQAGWLGLGPPYADPITGETISASANISVSGLDNYVARISQQVEALNGEIDPTDLVYGFDVERYMRAKLLQSNGLTSLRPTQGARERMDMFFDGVRERGPDSIQDLPPGRDDRRMEKLAGTDLEQRMITDDDVIAMGRVDPLAASSANLDDQLLEQVSPMRGGNMLKKYQERQRQIVAMGQRAMDAPEYLDKLTIGSALAMRGLSAAERFKRLREETYVAVTLHEVGHNTGLMHNMAASSDALNYGKTFWDLQKLPTNIDDAIDELSGETDAVSVQRLNRLQECQTAIAEIGTDAALQIDASAADMTAQECLGQTEVMYASIMDYHGTWNSDWGLLGPYDLAANKFAYGQLVETFADGALKTGVDARNIKRNVFLNGWETIPTALVDGVDNINNRTYQKIDWNTSSTRTAPLNNEVPYKFGYGAQMTPDEKTFDFGPDFRTNAKNELTRYYQGYFFSHFSRNRLWDFDISGPVGADLGVMLDFTEKMQWLFFYEATDPDFRGSHAEEDMLGTAMTGLNLMGHIIGEPGSGRYTTLQKLDLFNLLDAPTSERTADASNIMIPWTNIGECTARQVAVTDTDDNGTFVGSKPGHRNVVVPLSEGRPFFIGLTDDYEDWYLTYVGSYWTKSYAIQLLGYNYGWFPRSDGNADPRLWDVSWYRLFPNEVSRLYNALIADRSQDLGPVLDNDGKIIPRDLINADGSTPDYSGMTTLLPSLSFNHQYLALAWANIYMNSSTDETLDMPKRMLVALEGGNDDMSAFASADPSDVAKFVHPISGLSFRALKVGDHPIAYDLVNRLNRLKERYEVLNQCVADMDDNDAGTDSQLTEPFCECVDYYLDAASGDCTIQTFEKVGTGLCTDFALRQRRDSARETMDDLADYVGDLRSFNKIFNIY